jgi:hypothetical protein
MESFVEVGQGPNWGCSAKEKKNWWILQLSLQMHQLKLPHMWNGLLALYL